MRRRLPPPADLGVRRTVRRALRVDDVKIAVIDDDPTGTQTVRDVPLVTAWDEAELAWAIGVADPLFAILTNSRSLSPARAIAINGEIGRRLPALARRLGVELRVISRSDSTLRGHFPAEAEALAAGLAEAGQPVDCVLVCPAFPEAGRITAGGVHWVSRADRLVPVADTDYARDAAFGYRSSKLVDWVRERAGADARVASVTIEDVRRGGPHRVAELLRKARGRARYVVADAVEGSDLDLLAWGVSLAEQDGVSVLCRTGPSFLSARAGLALARPLSKGEIVSEGRGLLVIGSHTELTTEQLEQACARHWLQTVTLDVEELLAADRDRRRSILARAAAELRKALSQGDAALTTNRQLASAARGERSLDAIAAIGGALVEIVRLGTADTRLSWLVAKGGITSHDVATRALGARRATVLGQVFPGQVSVWELGEGSLRKGVRFVVFPGNVGDRLALADTLDRLKGWA
jgi:uncharacterized protein YgbK (DUF1537 family)